MSKLPLAVVTLSLGSLPAQAQSALSPEAEAAVQAEARKVAAWGKGPEFVKAVNAQNARRMSLSQIQEIDNAWIAGGEEARARELLANACSVHLKALLAKSPAYSESFVVDNQGANVCMSAKTSDYWQGDEAKWRKSYNGGNGRLFIDKPRYDTSAKSILVQVSFPVLDGAQTIGAITVGIDASRLTAAK